MVHGHMLVLEFTLLEIRHNITRGNTHTIPVVGPLVLLQLEAKLVDDLLFL